MSTWILLRGLTREARHWGDFPNHLQIALPGARVISMDLPGNGHLNALSSPSQIVAMVAHCRQEAARLDLAPPYGLLAMSLGAMVAAAWAADQPGEISNCVLINTSFGGFSPLRHRLRPRSWPLLLRYLFTGSVQKREELVFRLTSRMVPEPARVLSEWVAISLTRPVGTLNAWRQLMAAARFHAPQVAPVPSLMLVSRRDGLVDPRCSEETARRWGCDLAIHPEAGHDLPLDDGPWVAGAIRSWLARASRGR